MEAGNKNVIFSAFSSLLRLFQDRNETEGNVNQVGSGRIENELLLLLDLRLTTYHKYRFNNVNSLIQFK